MQCRAANICSQLNNKPRVMAPYITCNNIDYCRYGATTLGLLFSWNNLDMKVGVRTHAHVSYGVTKWLLLESYLQRKARHNYKYTRAC